VITVLNADGREMCLNVDEILSAIEVRKFHAELLNLNFASKEEAESWQQYEGPLACIREKTGNQICVRDSVADLVHKISLARAMR
jgi:uncharacterized protein YlzI (FlbEa/FlbD family)